MPPRLDPPTTPTRAGTPSPRAFFDAFLTTPADGPKGRAWIMEPLKDLLHDHRGLRPRLIRAGTEWRPFPPSDPEPAGWPTGQYLLTPDPHVKWDIDGAGYADDRYSQISAADLDPDIAESLLPELLGLIPHGLDYGLVHAWHDEEPNGPTGLRADHGGWMLLTPRDLSERLPTLFWAQVFGPPWVELFGAERLASTPAHPVEKVAPGH